MTSVGTVAASGAAPGRLDPDRPVVASPHDELPSSGPAAPASIDTVERRLDEQVVGRRAVVVAVPELAAVDEPPDAGELGRPRREPDRAVLGDVDPHEAVGEASGPSRRPASAAGSGRCRRAGLDRRPAERRHRDRGQDLATVRRRGRRSSQSVSGAAAAAARPRRRVRRHRARAARRRRRRRSVTVGISASRSMRAPFSWRPNSSRPWRRRRKSSGNPSPRNRRPGDHRVPARELLGRHGRPALGERRAPRRPARTRRRSTRSVRVVGDGLTTAQPPSGTPAAMRRPVR